MKSISWNVNGLRAIERKGFSSWFAKQDADIISLQEIKARPDKIPDSLRGPLGYHGYFCCAEKPGYSGVAVYSKKQPRQVVYGMGDAEIDREGRIIYLVFEDFTLLNAYMPHARRDLSRKDFKLRFCAQFLAFVERLKRDVPPLIICGDYNVAHEELDLTHPGPNRNNAGFLPEERNWMDQLLKFGFTDVFREQFPGENGHYTWWSNRKGVRERNVGWRIDYHLVDVRLKAKVENAGHQTDVLGSDHCPVVLEWS